MRWIGDEAPDAKVSIDGEQITVGGTILTYSILGLQRPGRN